MLRDAKLIADTARDVLAELVKAAGRTGDRQSRFDASLVLQSLVAEASDRVLASAVTKFDLKAPERFLPTDSIDDILHSHCQALLEERLAQSATAAALATLMDIDTATAAMLESASTDLLQCGCDRRTLIFVPKGDPQAAAKTLREAHPQAAVIPTDIDDVIVISEEAGISPRSLGRAMERVFPGIADAARRLLTRTDIDWQRLV